MQNLGICKENTNPDDFLNTSSANPATALDPVCPTNNILDLDEEKNLDTAVDKLTITIGSNRPKFSFASNYTPSRHFSGLSTSCGYGTSNPLVPVPPSFAVLNNDYVSSSPHSNKPNAIVRPVRRTEQTALPKAYNGPDHELRVTGYNPLLSVTYPQPNASNARYFAEELSRKLSHLSSIQEGEHFKSSSHHASNQDTLSQRPLFITTVPRGIFLPPPKEIILLSPSRKRQLYAYASHPVIYNTTSSTLPTSYYNNTHIGHKIKGTNEHNYSSKSTLAIAKDKCCRDEINTEGGGDTSASAMNEATTATVTDAKESSPLNSVRRYAASTPVPGGLHISKQEFHEQLKQNRSKRETPAPEPYKNVMYERRVARGSNFAPNPLLEDYDPFDRAADFRRRQFLRKIAHKNQRNVLGTPPPVTGRRHEVVQTEKYLEKLVARPTAASIETQTDLFLEKPPTPPYIPAKIGIDVGTEIKDGELFHFDAEAQPIIDIMVDNVLELSILEVAHEQEISAMRKKQQQLLAEREKELAEIRRLEEEELRLQAEKERRLRQDKIAKSLDEEMQRGVTAAKLLQGHIASILPEILNSLEPATEATKKEELMKTVCPWLSAEVAEEVGQIVDSREILTAIIQEIVKQRSEIYGGYKEETSENIEFLDEEEHGATELCEMETEEEPHRPTCEPDVTK